MMDLTRIVRDNMRCTKLDQNRIKCWKSISTTEPSTAVAYIVHLTLLTGIEGKNYRRRPRLAYGKQIMKYVGCTKYVEKKRKTEKSIMESCCKPVLGTMTRRRRRNL
jgi:hypothetical protein